MNSAANITDWDDYSLSFQSVMPSQMLALNREVSSYMSGEVADYGCGAGKIIPFLAQQAGVTGYIGIDSAAEMVAKATWMAAKFPQMDSRLICEKIENTTLPPVGSALSINSHYTWPDTKAILQQIYRQLRPGGLFVLATINRNIDMARLLGEAEVEMIAHPHWQQFKDHNMKISQNDGLTLKSLNELISEVQSVGFSVVEAHQKLYLGGLNFLVLEKN